MSKRIWKTIEELRELIAELYKELAKQANVVSGSMRITISDGRAVKIEATQYVITCCTRRKDGEWDVVNTDLNIHMNVAPQFVSDHLNGLIVEYIGNFGHLGATLKDGDVTGLEVYISLRPDRNQHEAKTCPS